MPTLVGTIFLCFAAFFFLFRQDRLFGLLILSSIFQGSYALKFGTRGLPAFSIIEILIILRSLGNLVLRPRRQEPLPERFWMLLFGAIAVATAFTAPFIFAGMPIYDPVLGIDLGAFVRPPLHFGMSNVTQVTYLCWHMATAFALMAIPYSAERTHKAYLVAFYILSLCIFAQAFCRVAGIPFPDSIVRNSGPDLMSLMDSPSLLRKPGTFTEPSFAGACLVLFSIGFLVEYFEGKGKSLRVLTAFAASLAASSSGSLLTLGAFVVYLIFRYSPFRFPWYIHVSKGKRVLGFAILSLAPVILAFPLLVNYRQVILEMTVSKGETGSFLNRTISDIYALGILAHTYGIGVGLGSNRPSSLVTSLLSNVGIAGFLTFAIFYYRLFVRVPKNYDWLMWGGAALMFNMCVNLPDVTFPTLWVAIFMAMQSQRSQTGQAINADSHGLSMKVLNP